MLSLQYKKFMHSEISATHREAVVHKMRKVFDQDMFSKVRVTYKYRGVSSLEVAHERLSLEFLVDSLEEDQHVFLHGHDG